MKYATLISALIFSAFQMQAQELQVEVTINTPQLQTVDPKVFKTLETGIEEFMNNQKWTDDVFEIEERIKCQIQITIEKETSPTSFEGEIAIQASRPVYNSSYESITFYHLDKDFNFDYTEYQPLQYVQNTYIDNLTAILSFYAYIVLGTDYDTFSPFGGDEHFQTAWEILNAVPQGAAGKYRGWRSIEGQRNRYWMIENLLNARVKPYRQAMYDYHRQALDLMYKDPEAARATITKAFDLIEAVNRDYLNAMILQMFANAKASEIIEIYKQGTREEKFKVKALMTKIDPANSTRYRAIGG